MDQLSYSYQAGTNRLLRVSDAYGSAGVGDLPHQVDAINYEYDPIGNLVRDHSEGIDQISWTVYGKIWEIQKQGAGSAIKYRYDASGNRVYKEGSDGTKTFYVRDATGNTMAIYEKTGTGSLVLKEQELYGSSRLGTYQRNVEVENLGEQLIMGEGSYIWGSRFFELSNHLGNVLATIQDRMTVNNTSGVDYFDPVVVSAQDYYAFGMMMPGRTYSAPGGYRYGFNTQEKVDEIASGHYTAMYWEYDSRLGRRWNVDPVKKPWQSDYSCFSNSPIWKVDPNGDDDFFNADGTFSHSTKTGTKIYVQTASGNVAYSQLPMNSMHNRQTLANITAYYAGQVGISGTVGVSNYPKNRNSKALAFTKGNEIYVNARADGVGVTPLFDDYNNLKSALRHEKDHKDKG